MRGTHLGAIALYPPLAGAAPQAEHGIITDAAEKKAMPTQTRPKIRFLLISVLALFIISCIVAIILALTSSMLSPALRPAAGFLGMILYFVFFVTFPLFGFLVLLFPKAATFHDTEQEFYVPLGPLYWRVKSFIGLAIIFIASSSFVESIVKGPLESTSPYHEPLNYLMSFLGLTCFMILGALLLFFPKHITQIAMNLMPTRITNKMDLNPDHWRSGWGWDGMRFGGVIWLAMALFGLYFVIKNVISLYQ